MSPNHEELVQRIERDLLDSHDEELELEIEDRDLADRLDGTDSARTPSDKQARLAYFREQIRLLAELIKLQDWVAHEDQEVVILFEGRDAPGIRSRSRSSCPGAADRLEGSLPAQKYPHLQRHRLHFDISTIIEI